MQAEFKVPITIQTFNDDHIINMRSSTIANGATETIQDAILMHELISTYTI